MSLAADSSSATDWGTLIAAGIAILISLGALWYARISANASKEAAVAAKESARHAASSAASEASVARVEMDRHHRDNQPPVPGPDAFSVVQVSGIGKTHHRLMFTYTPGRSYRVKGVAFRNARQFKTDSEPLAIAPVIPRGVPVRVVIDEVPEEFMLTVFASLRMQFWPPAPGESTDPWECQCGRPLSDEPHWEWTVPIKMPRRDLP